MNPLLQFLQSPHLAGFMVGLLVGLVFGRRPLVAVLRRHVEELRDANRRLSAALDDSWWVLREREDARADSEPPTIVVPPENHAGRRRIVRSPRYFPN